MTSSVGNAGFVALILGALLAVRVVAQDAGLVTEGEEPLATRVEVRHPSPPLFGVDSDGWPVTSDAGFVSLRPRGSGFVYWEGPARAWMRRRHPEAIPDAPIPLDHQDTWALIETLSVLRAVLDDFSARHPTAPPVRLTEISGAHGGFPDVYDWGYSGHLSHQSGHHVNVLLVPAVVTEGRVFATPNNKSRWNQLWTLDLLEAMYRHGACLVYTNTALDPFAFRGSHPELARFDPRPASKNDHTISFRRSDGAVLSLRRPPRDHADVIACCFAPRETQNPAAAFAGARPAGRPKPPVGRGAGVGSISLRSTPARASVYLDGRYAGESGPAGPLEFLGPPGHHQLRVSRRGHADLIERVEIRPGIRTRIRAALAPHGRAAKRSASARAQVRAGQMLRGRLDEEAHSYVFEGRAGRRRDVVVHWSETAVVCRVKDARGRNVALRKAPLPPGNPKEVQRWSFDVTGPGFWTVEIARGAEAPAGSYVIGFEKSPPPPYPGDTGGKGKRLLAGKPEPR